MTITAGRSTVSPARESVTMTVGEFLLRRIREAGVSHAFGVPGDYNLELLQQLEDTGALEWIGACNELNASYAADGYARLNGLAALIVTNAVGALSAINGVAGSYAEHVPVICICGSIPFRSMERGLGMHHTMADGTWGRFLGAYAAPQVRIPLKQSGSTALGDASSLELRCGACPGAAAAGVTRGRGRRAIVRARTGPSCPWTRA